jgi:tellurium resistance protein TerD
MSIDCKEIPMMKLELNKNGDAPKSKLSLALKKEAIFNIELLWDGDADLDTHALLAHNDGNGAKVTAFEQILSTYNVKRGTSSAGILTAHNPDGSVNANGKGWFETPCGALRHSGDKLEGDSSDIDEIITVNGFKCESRVNEIPFFTTIHKPAGATFAQVRNAIMRIKDETGKGLGAYQLSKEFGKFNAVQLGSLLLSANGWEFAPAGTGFNGDFNTILEYFS